MSSDVEMVRERYLAHAKDIAELTRKMAAKGLSLSGASLAEMGDLFDLLVTNEMSMFAELGDSHAHRASAIMDIACRINAKIANSV